MIREICYGLIGNFIFSLGLYTYKKYHHYHYDEIKRRLDKLEQLIETYNSINKHQNEIGICKDDKFENVQWVSKDYFNKNI